MSGRLVLQKIKLQTITKPAKTSDSSTKNKINTRRVIWSHGKKQQMEKSGTVEQQKGIKKYPSRLRLDSIKQRSSSSKNLESMEILKPIRESSKGGITMDASRPISKILATQINEGEHPLVQQKLRMATVAFQRN